MQLGHQVRVGELGGLRLRDHHDVTLADQALAMKTKELAQASLHAIANDGVTDSLADAETDAGGRG